MGTITAEAIINKAATVLMDVANVKWSRDELLGWLNDGQRSIVSMVPEASSTITTISMTSGTRQSLPAGAWMLLDVTRNMGANGSTPGRAVQRIDRHTLDESNPNWQSATPVTSIKCYMYSLRDRSHFYVHPPADGTTKVEVIYSAHPTDISVENTAIGIHDMYQPALLDYMLARAFSKKSQYSDPAAATAYFNAFTLFVVTNAQDAAQLTSMLGALRENIAPTVGTTPGGPAPAA